MLMVDGKCLDDPQQVFVIAEAAGSHGQEYAKAVQLVNAAAQAGADAVKFQLITPELICADIPIPFGQNAVHDRWLQEMGVTHMRQLFAKGGLPRTWCVPLKRLAESLGLAWLCTPFSLEEAQFLVEEVQVSALKIASGDLTFAPLLAYAVETGLPLIVSTGGATMAECDTALSGPLWAATDRLVMLHCCSVYPAPSSFVNLACIPAMEECLSVPIGFSDHTLDIVMVPTMAVAVGACVYEKHMALSRHDGSIDAAHSLEPGEFSQMVSMIREASLVRGDGHKFPHDAELHDRLWSRRDPSDWLRPQLRGRLGDWE